MDSRSGMPQASRRFLAVKASGGSGGAWWMALSALMEHCACTVSREVSVKSDGDGSAATLAVK